MSHSDILTVSETADILRVSIKTVREMIKSGQLSAVKIGKGYRLRRSDVESLFDRTEKHDSCDS